MQIEILGLAIHEYIYNIFTIINTLQYIRWCFFQRCIMRNTYCNYQIRLSLKMLDRLYRIFVHGHGISHYQIYKSGSSPSRINTWFDNLLIHYLVNILYCKVPWDHWTPKQMYDIICPIFLNMQIRHFSRENICFSDFFTFRLFTVHY